MKYLAVTPGYLAALDCVFLIFVHPVDCYAAICTLICPSFILFSVRSLCINIPKYRTKRQINSPLIAMLWVISWVLPIGVAKAIKAPTVLRPKCQYAYPALNVYQSAAPVAIIYEKSIQSCIGWRGGLCKQFWWTSSLRIGWWPVFRTTAMARAKR